MHKYSLKQLTQAEIIIHTGRVFHDMKHSLTEMKLLNLYKVLGENF